MRHLLALLIIVVLSLTVAGCDTNKDQPPAPDGGAARRELVASGKTMTRWASFVKSKGANRVIGLASHGGSGERV